MGQMSIAGLLRGAYGRGCRLWQGRRLLSHENLSRKHCLCCSCYSHVSSEHGESIAGKGSFWPSKDFPTSCLESKAHMKMNNMQAHMASFCTGGRSFSSFEKREPLTSLDSRSLGSTALDMQILSAATDMTDVETDTSSSESVEDFDFRNFPALHSSFFQDYKRPSQLERRKKRMGVQSSRKPFDAGNKLTVESIPQPKGYSYDFGLEDMPTVPPPLEVGARPQGGFDIDISLDNCEKVSSKSPVSSPVFPRVPSLDLPSDTPRTDNLSQVSRGSFETEAVEQEYWWDPYDFDAQMDLPHKLETEE